MCKLRFHCLVLDINFDWLALKMLESIVSVLPSDWFSLSRWPRFQLTHGKTTLTVVVLKSV